MKITDTILSTSVLCHECSKEYALKWNHNQPNERTDCLHHLGYTAASNVI